MDIRELETALLDQKEELEALRNKSFCYREEERMINLESSLAQVVIGVRRSGKSTLCFNALERSKVSYAYVNFDDENLIDLSVKDMNNVLQVLYSIYGDFTHLFFDEIQNIEGWHLFVNRMLRKGIHVLLTGSNSKLLSGELASHLTGRHHTIELLPFSFKDWCSYNGIAMAPLTTRNKGFLMGAFDKYLHQGGFPELLVEPDHTNYIESLFHDIITQDIRKRFKVKYIDSLERLARHLLNISPAVIVKDKLQKQFGFKSHHTLGNYLSYMTQTYLLCKVSKYSSKSKERSVAEKVYAIDVAFMNKRENAFAGDNLGWRLETMVYLELRRRIKTAEEDIYYFDNGNTEADFIVCSGSKVMGIYQVAYDIENPRTRRREINGAVAAAKHTKCSNVFILTDHHSETIVNNGIEIKSMPVWEWIVRGN
ncbi:MAG TPA: ATP-binding protein [Candidatus Coprenecus merdipullorum]|nr:ATP-binding protein [Candidatus Coprenecus merdipullorum]